MARRHANGARIYRAVLVVTHASGEVTTLYYGPYDTPGPAKGQVTSGLTRWGWHQGTTVAGHVESSAVVWARDE
jgi:hypothetical protein